MRYILYTLYSLLLGLFFILVLPLLVWRDLRSGKYRGSVAARFGQLDAKLLADCAQGKTIWLHAVSVGEAMAAKDLAKQLKERYPDHLLVISTVTKTGRQVVLEQIPEADHHLYLPLDFRWVVKRVVRAIRPRLMVVMETELWPHLFRAIGEAGTPLLVVNGRLSPGSYRNYYKFRAAMSPFLKPVRRFCMQSVLDGERMFAIIKDEARVQTTGNIKYDQALTLPKKEAWQQLKRALGPLPAQQQCIMAASTHSGEETIVLQSFTTLRQQFPELRLILAPRHPERSDEVAGLIQQAGFTTTRLSQAAGHWREPVLLVDGIGWLTRLYRGCHGVYMGGSLIPRGGQNMLEPSAWGVPTLFGPHTFNFKHISQQLCESGGAIRVEDEQMLTQGFQLLLEKPELRNRMGEAAKQVVTRNTGALARTMEQITELYPATNQGPKA
uniref:3-deoxy-D-manno-octulosonic acid transferase n=1 Tax=Magnetococcus massalia (strain MO-1) TaxID=451514 RepID=A0A1S7LJQ3_MAGMO|nr:GT30 : 3-Deoxy-D-manno-octulosonic-acid transferase (kdotransferase) [Candidatus Magnetococcus massalia]